MNPSYHHPKDNDKGQGLVEYALLLTLVAVVVIAVLTILGTTVNDVFCQVISGLNGASGNGCVSITKVDYMSNSHQLHLDATVNGGYDSSVTLTASPGGVMSAKKDHYHLKQKFTECPCTITITSSEGGSSTVTFGP